MRGVIMEHLPGYDNYKQGGGMPHNEDRTDPYEVENGDRCDKCDTLLKPGREWLTGPIMCWYCPDCGREYQVGEPDPPGYDPDNAEM